MTKQRMTSLDVRASVEEMRNCLIGLRLINLYDLSPTMYLFKFGHGERKYSVLLESGVRLHLTRLVRETPRLPSQFTHKLRKHVRAWRLNSISQMQHDRTIDMCFGVASSTSCFHIIIELFSRGNVVLTDHSYSIMMLLRTHKDSDVKLMVHGVYPAITNGAGDLLCNASHNDPVKGSRADCSKDVGVDDAVTYNHDRGGGSLTSEFESAAVTQQRGEDRQQRDDDGDEKDKRVGVLSSEWRISFDKQSDYESIKAIISDVRHFGNSLAEYVLAATDTANIKKKNITQSSEQLFAQLLPGMLAAWDLQHLPLPPGGYLIALADKKNQQQQSHEKHSTNGGKNDVVENADGSDLTDVTGSVVHYEDFSPLLLTQHKKPCYVATHRNSFGVVCDTFFLPTERDKIDHHNAQQQKTVLSKREKFERDHARRISALEREQEANYRRGELILTNAERVDAALGLINGALAAGIQWEALRSLLKRRHEEGHPVAYLIHELCLERNTISVLLEQSELYDDEDDKDVTPEVVELDLTKSSYANADGYFHKRKANQIKLHKTLAATAKAAAGALHKGTREAAKTKTRKRIVVERMRNWWERFRWFRTSAGDVVLQGRDIPSTDILLRQRAQLGDIFVYCDMDDALPCLLRPLTSLWQQTGTTAKQACGDAEASTAADSKAAAAAAACTNAAALPEETVTATTQSVCSVIARVSIEEAGAWCVSNSRAWESKQSVGAWWVYASQLTGGSAATRYTFGGAAHHILPQPLALGCGLLFRVSRDVRQQDGTKVGDWEMSDVDRVNVGMWESAVATRTDNDGNSSSSGGGGGDTRNSSKYIVADTATTMPVLPPVSSSYRTAARPPAQTNRSQGNGNRANQKNSANPGTSTSNPSSSEVNSSHHTEEANESSTNAASAIAASSAPTSQLTSRQRRKLKKIHDRYRDQDDEDRFLGAQLNGNHLSKVHHVDTQQVRKRPPQQHATAPKSSMLDQPEVTAHAANVVIAEVTDTTLHTTAHETFTSPASAQPEGEIRSVGYDPSCHAKRACSHTEPAEERTDDDDDNEEGEEDGSVAHGRSIEPVEKEKHPSDRSSPASLALSCKTDAVDTRCGKNHHDSKYDRNANAAGASELATAFVHWTASPQVSDTILYAEMVCAPFSTVVSYPYRVELAMASVKKGVVAHSIVASFAQRATQRTAAAAVAEGSMSCHDSTSGSMHQSGVDKRVTEESVKSKAIREAILNVDMGYFVEQLRAHAKPLNINAQR